MSSAAPELRKKAKALRAARERSLRKSGNMARKDFNKAAASATGGDREYSGEPGVKLAVKVKVAGGAKRSTLTITPTGKSAGQWVWATEGTKAGARRIRSGRRRGTVMRHPGTPGRGAWTDTADAVKPKILQELGNQVRAVFR